MHRLESMYPNQNIIKNQLLLEANNDYNIEMRLNANEAFPLNDNKYTNQTNQNNKDSSIANKILKSLSKFKSNKTGNYT